MSKTHITFHNGILTIGGTIIEIAYEDSHIFFDFGSEYNPAIPASNLQELLDKKMVPYINNIFDPRIELIGYESVNKSGFKNEAVFLSHVHLDHSKIVNYLNPSIPLYTLEGTKSLLETLNINDDFLFPLIPAQKNKSKNTVRTIIGTKSDETIEIGKIKVTLISVDHDAYGSCGLFIQTPDLSIAYTGDLRLHGYRKADTMKFCQICKNCDVLLIEGVSVSFQDTNYTPPAKEISNEQDLINKISELVNENPEKQITFNYYISNIERIMKIIDAVPRKVVLSAYYSYILKDATGYQSYYYNLDGRDYGLAKDKCVEYDTLLSDHKEYMWQLTSTDDIDKLLPNGIYIHSNAVPLGHFDPRFAPFMQQFESKNIKFEWLCVSGHAYPKDLIRIIDSIKPKLLVPIHSYRPERLYNKYGRRLLPKKGQIL
ncbi:MAG: MBL fold metallo-hydrolase [Candidatus Epulonipiscioides saccharophilum]|nr:MAG: MBL fold metallo-hydrolase [Epulopiscium sp. AS2M-Bin001]